MVFVSFWAENGHGVFSPTWPPSIQIHWNKQKGLYKKRLQLPQDLFGTPTCPLSHCFGTPIWPSSRHVKNSPYTLPILVLESGMVFEGITEAYELIYHFNAKWVGKKEKYANWKWNLRNLIFVAVLIEVLDYIMTWIGYLKTAMNFTGRAMSPFLESPDN